MASIIWTAICAGLLSVSQKIRQPSNMHKQTPPMTALPIMAGRPLRAAKRPPEDFRRRNSEIMKFDVATLASNFQTLDSRMDQNRNERSVAISNFFLIAQLLSNKFADGVYGNR